MYKARKHVYSSMWISAALILIGLLRIYGQDESIVATGTVANITSYPYHVVIYEKVGKPEEYKQICGGTLISTTLVVSAAHCFWDNEHNTKKSSNLYKIRAGNLRRTWNHDGGNLSGVQERQVANITLPRRYLGSETFYENDIAVVALHQEILVTSAVDSVDVDWQDLWTTEQLISTKQGTVAGWGVSNTGNESAVLRVVSIPFVDPQICFDSLEFYLKPFLAHDKFCAGFSNQSVYVCRGDSGGGLVFHRPADSKRYLRGVLSVAFKPTGLRDACFEQQYTTFTIIKPSILCGLIIPLVQEQRGLPLQCGQIKFGEGAIK